MQIRRTLDRVRGVLASALNRCDRAPARLERAEAHLRAAAVIAREHLAAQPGPGPGAPATPPPRSVATVLTEVLAEVWDALEASAQEDLARAGTDAGADDAFERA
jgi:hypothetical protein